MNIQDKDELKKGAGGGPSNRKRLKISPIEEVKEMSEEQ
jgi:hypothetical protein